MIGLILGIAMLMPLDTVALNNSGLSPAARQTLATTLATRTQVVASAQYSTYPADADSVVLSHTFPAGAFTAGNQVRMHIYGRFVNTGGVTDSFTPSVYVTQSSSIQTVGALYASATGGRFVIDGEVSFNAPGPPSTGDNDKRVSPGYSSGSLVVGSMVRYWVAKSVTFDQDIAVATNPNAFQIITTSPVGIALSVNTGPNTTFQVMGGWMEAM